MTMNPDAQLPHSLKFLVILLIALVSAAAVLQVDSLTSRERGGFQVQDYYNYSIVTEAYAAGRMDSPWSLEGLKESYRAKFNMSLKRPMLMALGPIGLVLIDSPRWIFGSPGIATYRAWSALSIIALVVGLLYFLRQQESSCSAVWALLLVIGISASTRVSLTLGQTTLLGFACLLLVMSEYPDNRRAGRGIVSDLVQASALLISSMKPAYFLPVVAVLIADRRIRPFAIAGLAFLLISFIHADGSIGAYLVSYLSSLRTYVPNSPNTIEGAPISSYTLPALLTAFGTPLYTANKIATISAAIFALLAIFVTLVYGRGKLIQALVLISLSTLVLTPYIGSYDLQMIIAPALTLWLLKGPDRIEFAGLTLLFAICGNAIFFSLPGWAVLVTNLSILIAITLLARGLISKNTSQSECSHV